MDIIVMMKRILLLVLMIGFLAAAYRYRPAQPNWQPATSPFPSPTSAFPKRVMGLVEHEDEMQMITVSDQQYRFIFRVVQPERAMVGVNQDLQASSSALRDEHRCTILVNGGFYNTNDQPIGLLVNEGEVLSAWQANKLFNGVIGWDKDEKQVRLATDRGEGMWWGIQAGPVVWLHGQAMELRLNRDQAARRIIAGVTNANELFLTVITAADSLFGGPLLAETPAILSKIQETTGIKLSSALNLDGGTASAFLTEGFQIKELAPIGSFLCVK